MIPFIINFWFRAVLSAFNPSFVFLPGWSVDFCNPKLKNVLLRPKMNFFSQFLFWGDARWKLLSKVALSGGCSKQEWFYSFQSCYWYFFKALPTAHWKDFLWQLLEQSMQYFNGRLKAFIAFIDFCNPRFYTSFYLNFYSNIEINWSNQWHFHIYMWRATTRIAFLPPNGSDQRFLSIASRWFWRWQNLNGGSLCVFDSKSFFKTPKFFRYS